MEETTKTIEELQEIIADLKSKNEQLAEELSTMAESLDREKKLCSQYSNWWDEAGKERDRLRNALKAVGTIIGTIA